MGTRGCEGGLLLVAVAGSILANVHRSSKSCFPKLNTAFAPSRRREGLGESLSPAIKTSFDAPPHRFLRSRRGTINRDVHVTIALIDENCSSPRKMNLQTAVLLMTAELPFAFRESNHHVLDPMCQPLQCVADAPFDVLLKSAGGLHMVAVDVQVHGYPLLSKDILRAGPI